MRDIKFDFELSDTKSADELVKDYSNKIVEWTNNFVLCEIVLYE